jgi:ADP-ribose pyrophosphatase YjhB (NUDIX family)
MTGKGPYTYDYPRPMVTVDAVVFTVRDEGLEVLMIRRKHDPFAGAWALPGGFVDMEESLDTAVARELAEETSVTGVHLEQFRTFGDPNRDPRGRSISVAFLGVTDWPKHVPRADDDAAEAAWLPLDELPDLAFDHNLIVGYAVKRMRALVEQDDSHSALLRAIPLQDLRRALKALPQV